MKSLSNLDQFLAGGRSVTVSFRFFPFLQFILKSRRPRFPAQNLRSSQTLAVPCISLMNVSKGRRNLKPLSPPSSCVGNNLPLVCPYSTLDFCLSLTLQCAIYKHTSFHLQNSQPCLLSRSIYYPYVCCWLATIYNGLSQVAFSSFHLSLAPPFSYSYRVRMITHLKNFFRLPYCC